MGESEPDRPPLFCKVSECRAAKIRLLCFPSAGGNSRFYSSWASDFPTDIELLTLDLPGRWERCTENPYSQVETLLVDIASEIREQWSDKPVIFYGHSFGAYLAFFLTTHLEKTQTIMPTALFLSATPAPQSPSRQQLQEEVDKLRTDEEFVEFLKGAIPDELAIDCEDFIREELLSPFKADAELAVQLGAMPIAKKPPLSCPIYYFEGSDDKSFQQDSQGWRNMTGGHFYSETLPGGHNFVLKDRNYQRIISHIKNISDKIQST